MIGQLTVLAVIAARGGSKGIPGKNLVEVGGRPLILWTIDAALAAKHVDRVILSSDDPAIIKIAELAGCQAPFRRASQLATDTAKSIDVVLDAIARVPGYDVVVLLQPTSPLRTAADIDGTLERMEISAAPSCVSIRPAADHPYHTFEMDELGRIAPYAAPADNCSLRRQDLPPAWCLNGAVYAARTAWLSRERSFVGVDTVGYEMPIERSIDIDAPADLELVRAYVLAKESRRTEP